MNELSSTPPDPRPRDFVSWRRDAWMFADGGVVILMYHKIAPTPAGTNWPSLYVGAGAFDRHLAELTGAGLACLPYTEMLSTVEAGGSGFCVSFDDGFRNVSENALPILQTRGLRAMQFIVAGLIGGEDAWDRAIGEPPHALMDESEIRGWLMDGHEIGSHTLTHPPLTTVPPARARAEVFDSKKLLEDRFGVPVRHFCYPYGDHDARIRDLVAEAGYESAPTVRTGANGPGADPLGLRRVMACNAP